MSHADFKDKVKDWWGGACVEGWEVKGMKNQLITFFSIVIRQELFGCCFSQCSGCSGCCQPRLRRRFRGGMGLLWKRRGRVLGKQVLCAFFGRFGRQGTKLPFEEEELSIQRLKASFVYFLWSETKRSLKDGPSTLVDFVGWVASR